MVLGGLLVCTSDPCIQKDPKGLSPLPKTSTESFWAPWRPAGGIGGIHREVPLQQLLDFLAGESGDLRCPASSLLFKPFDYIYIYIEII